MNKKILIIPGIIIFLFLVLTILQLFLSKRQENFPFFTFSPTPTPVGGSTTHFFNINTKAPISITATDPQNNETNVALSKIIHIAFSRPIDPTEVVFTVSPTFSFTSSITDNTLTIKPSNKLSPYTQYSFFIAYRSFPPSDNYTFTTVSPNPSITPIQGDTVREHSDQNNKMTNPDLFLSNQTPYSTNDFQIESAFTPFPANNSYSTETAPDYTNNGSSGGGHFFFTVTLNKANPNAKNAFIQWLHSLTLSDDQIKQLDIRYQ